MKQLKKLACVLTAVFLLVTLLPVSAQAAAAKATTLRLETTEGTVSVKSASGRAVKYSDKSKLYSGYAVSTSAASYAWISLDDDSLIKLDENSAVTVKQSRKKLEVQLDRGKVFFNVSKPLAADASLDIRTSNMSTGIRGTSGLVSVFQESRPASGTNSTSGVTQIVRSSLLVYEGTVRLTTYTPLAAQGLNAPAVTTQAVEAGRLAQVTTISAVPVSGTPTIVSAAATLQPVSVAQELAATGFVAVEVAANPTLQAAIVQGSNDVTAESLPQITVHAEEQLQKDQSASAAQVLQEQAVLQSAVQEAGDAASAANSAAPAVVPVFAPSTVSQTAPPARRTITFRYQGNLFARQSVVDGNCVRCPSLQPTQSGSWQLDGAPYDFTRVVTGDLTLNWAASE